MEQLTSLQVKLVKRARLLVLAGMGYNTIEGVVAIASGVAAGSVALVGFGLDSYIEVFAAGVVSWRLSKASRGQAASEAAEKRALFLIGITFFALAIYIVAHSTLTIAAAHEPEESLVGIGVAIASLIVMPGLSFVKLRLAAKLHDKSLRAEAMETLICSYLSVALLLGLGLNAAFGWWWADPIVALAMVPWLMKEGWEGISED